MERTTFRCGANATVKGASKCSRRKTFLIGIFLKLDSDSDYGTVGCEDLVWVVGAEKKRKAKYRSPVTMDRKDDTLLLRGRF